MTWQSEDEAVFNELRNLPKRRLDPVAKQRILLQLRDLKSQPSSVSHRSHARWVGSTAAGLAALCLMAVIALLPEARTVLHNQSKPEAPAASTGNAYVSMLGFAPRLPSYIPKRLFFKQIHVETEDYPVGQRKSFTALFEDGQQSLTVTELAQSGTYALPDATSWQPLTINGQAAESAVLPNNRFEVKHTVHGVDYLVTATSGVSHDEVIQVASHLDAPVSISPSVITQNVAGYDRAVKQLSFSPVQQNFVPTGYQMKSASAHITVQQGTKDEAFALSYEDHSKHLFVVVQQTGRHDSSSGQFMNIAGQQVVVNGQNGDTMIWWFNAKNHLTYHVGGQVSLDFLIHVAEKIIQQG